MYVEVLGIDFICIGWVFWLNFIFIIIEFIGGWFINSVVIMVDVVYDLGDFLFIGLVWYLSKFGNKVFIEKYMYGFKWLSFMGVMINGVILVIGLIWVLFEVIFCLFNFEMFVIEGMIGLVIFGIVVNGFVVYKFYGGYLMNEKVFNWYLIEDMMGWVVVLVVVIVFYFVEWFIFDLILFIGFMLFILVNVVWYVV